MAAGQVQNELMLQKAYYAPWDDDREESGKHIKEYKARRKQLIREALEAATEEYWNAYEEGEKEGLAKATLGCIYSD